MYDLMRDLKYAFRRLARTPVFTLATVVTLALGIGANTAIFSVINSVLLSPSVPRARPPHRRLANCARREHQGSECLHCRLRHYREDSRTFADVAIWNGRSVTVTEFADPERVDGISLTFRLLPMLGVHPILGREFTEKDRNQSPEVVMLSYGYWQRRFGGDPKVIGRRIMADGAAREIIGVLPRDFWFMDMGHDLVLPLRFDRATRAPRGL